MNQTESGIILLDDEMELGVNLKEVYDTACFYKSRLPQFEDIYDEYKIKLIMKNVDIISGTVNDKLSILKAGDLLETGDDWDKEVPVKEKAELFHILVQKHYSFQAYNDVFNSPIKDVW